MIYPNPDHPAIEGSDVARLWQEDIDKAEDVAREWTRLYALAS